MSDLNLYIGYYLLTKTTLVSTLEDGLCAWYCGYLLFLRVLAAMNNGVK